VTWPGGAKTGGRGSNVSNTLVPRQLADKPIGACLGALGAWLAFTGAGIALMTALVSPPDHSITSSATASSDGGTVMPASLAA
jgi:hypothetical protein